MLMSYTLLNNKFSEDLSVPVMSLAVPMSVSCILLFIVYDFVSK